MNTHSRRLLPRQEAPEFDAKTCLAAFLILGFQLVLLTWALPLLLLGIGVLIGAALIATACSGSHREALSAGRAGESICTFARSFDCRAVDTRLIRATYEEVQAAGLEGFPPRRDDRLGEDLCIDEEDFDDTACEIARRAGRSMEGSEANPLYGKVETVGDLVLFLNHQPEAA